MARIEYAFLCVPRGYLVCRCLSARYLRKCCGHIYGRMFLRLQSEGAHVVVAVTTDEMESFVIQLHERKKIIMML